MRDKDPADLKLPEQEGEYWVDGHFTEWWTHKSYFSHDRQIFVPKSAVIKREENRIYLNGRWARHQIRIGELRAIDWSDKKDANLGLLIKAINVPWVKEYNPPFEVSL